MNLLDQSIHAAGGISALARSLGLQPNTISNWRARGGIPAGWVAALETMRDNGVGVFKRAHNTNVTERGRSVCAVPNKSN